jgi:hypothetical protein
MSYRRFSATITATAEGVGAIVTEGQYVYKPLLSGTREQERMLYAGASLKGSVIRSRRRGATATA